MSGGVAGPTRIELSVAGILNFEYFAARGTLLVDGEKGTKSGRVTYDPYPGGVGPGPDCTLFQTTRCFVGAKPEGPEPFVGPLELLGREFVSERMTTVGRSGVVSLSERTRFERGTLFTDLTAVGKFRVPYIRGVGPLHEIIKVADHDTLVSRGRYTLVTKTGRSIPVRYTHFYRALNPNRRLFGQLRDRVYLLSAEISTKARGRAVEYTSHSTVSFLRDDRSRHRTSRARPSPRRRVSR
jgi:hypothetical protein